MGLRIERNSNKRNRSRCRVTRWRKWTGTGTAKGHPFRLACQNSLARKRLAGQDGHFSSAKLVSHN